MACYPWVVPWERQGQNIADFPHLKRWLEAIKARPAVVKAYEWTPKINPDARRNSYGRGARHPVRPDRTVASSAGVAAAVRVRPVMRDEQR